MFWRRRFYKSPITSVAAGEKKRVLYHKGKICVRQLNLRYDANDTTGSYNNKWIIKIDGEELINMSFFDIWKFLGGSVSNTGANRPVSNLTRDDTNKNYVVAFLDLGTVEEGIEVWFENVDTANSCSLWVGMVYDVYEEEK